jgi:hypothetical protein
MLSFDNFLRIAELKTCREDFRIAHVGEPRQKLAYLCRDGIMLITVPSQYEFGLFLEIL